MLPNHRRLLCQAARGTLEQPKEGCISRNEANQPDRKHSGPAPSDSRFLASVDCCSCMSHEPSSALNVLEVHSEPLRTVDDRVDDDKPAFGAIPSSLVCATRRVDFRGYPDRRLLRDWASVRAAAGQCYAVVNKREMQNAGGLALDGRVAAKGLIVKGIFVLNNLSKTREEDIVPFARGEPVAILRVRRDRNPLVGPLGRGAHALYHVKLVPVSVRRVGRDIVATFVFEWKCHIRRIRVPDAVARRGVPVVPRLELRVPLPGGSVRRHVALLVGKHQARTTIDPGVSELYVGRVVRGKLSVQRRTAQESNGQRCSNDTRSELHDRILQAK